MAQFRQSGGFFDSRGSGAHHLLPEYHRAHPSKPSRIRRPGKPAARRRSPAVAAAAAALLLLAGVFLLSRRLSRDPTDINQDLDGGEGLPEWNRSKNWKELKFGHGGGGRSARDSRYWDRDDRRRDEDYSEDEEKISGAGGNTGDAGGEKGVTTDPGVEEKGLTLETKGGGEKEVPEVAEGGKGGTLYNEGGRKELEQHEVAAMGTMATGMRDVDPDDEYDDGIDAQDDLDDAQLHSSDGGRKLSDAIHESVEKKENVALETQTEPGEGISDGGDAVVMNQKKVSGTGDKKHGSKKKSKRKKSGELFSLFKFKC